MTIGTIPITLLSTAPVVHVVQPRCSENLREKGSRLRKWRPDVHRSIIVVNNDAKKLFKQNRNQGM